MIFSSLESKRQILVHYHIFKNAGTSIDAMLRASFRSRWEKFDPDLPVSDPSGMLAQFIAERPRVRAISSHTICPPLPAIEGTYLQPIFFLRHPIARVASAYK